MEKVNFEEVLDKVKLSSDFIWKDEEMFLLEIYVYSDVTITDLERVKVKIENDIIELEHKLETKIEYYDFSVYLRGGEITLGTEIKFSEEILEKYDFEDYFYFS